jgi:ubiquinol-cytochrome c reductase cytochrome c subunit
VARGNPRRNWSGIGRDGDVPAMSALRRGLPAACWSGIIQGLVGTLRAVGGLLALAAIAASGVFALGLAGGAAAGARLEPRAASPEQATQVDASGDARQLYLNTCATCHGADGRGTDTGPSLQDTGPAAFDFFLRTGRMPLSAPGQPAFRQGTVLSEAQIEALVAYGSSLGTGPAIPALATSADLPAGYQLFINNCAACHGALGSGGTIGPGVFAPSLRGKEPRTVAEAVVVGPGAMPRFDWDSQQLADVAAYVGQLGSGPTAGGITLGGYGPVAEGFVAVAVVVGLLVLIVRWIGRPEPGPEADEPPTEDAR